MVVLSGCLDSGVKECPWGLVCPSDQLCHEYDPLRYETAVRGRCVDPAQTRACQGKKEGDACTYDNLSLHCRDGICVDPRCGDMVADPTEGCDDGNNKDRDGCSASCQRERFTWTSVTISPYSATLPPPLYSAALACRKPYYCYLMGGRTDNGSLEGRSWSFDLTNGRWKLVTGSGPPARAGHAMVYEQVLKVVVLHGGQDSAGHLRDTWHFEPNSGWKRAHYGPKKRSGHAMAWDDNLNRLLVFGGEGQGLLGDLWTYLGAPPSPWVERKGKLPPARREHVMIHDVERRRTLMIGRVADAVADRGDCQVESPAQKQCALVTGWAFDGAAWGPMAGPHVSPGRWSTAGAFDRRAGHAVVFGGTYTDAKGKTQVLDDLWLTTPDGRGWRQHKRASSETWPPARYDHAMASLDDGRGVLLFGGRGKDGKVLGDAWIGRMEESTLCGNGSLDPGEVCDGVLRTPAKTCRDLGYSGGERRCVFCRWSYECFE